MRVLFLPLITGGVALGTISRCLAIAEELRQAGHEACFLTGGPALHHVAEAAFPVREGPLPIPPGPVHPMHNLADVARFLNLAQGDYVQAALDAELAAIDSFRPEVIFSEFKLTAPLAAARSGLPLVSTACTPAHPRFVSPLFAEPPRDPEAAAPFNRLLMESGANPVSDVAELFFMRSELKIVPASARLEPMLQAEDSLHYVGYLLYDRWERAPIPPRVLERATAPRLIFVYFSVGEIGPERYLDVLPKAFDGTEFQAVVAVGDHPALRGLPRATANVRYVDFVPGSSILEVCDGLVFHGGQNTAMAALLHGRPSLIIPGSDFERDFNARRIVELGAGLRLTPDEFTPGRVLQAVRELQGEGFQRRALAHGRELAALGGPRRAAELIVQAGKRGRRRERRDSPITGV